jgi:peptide-methionine (S)-S-oxide reductase
MSGLMSRTSLVAVALVGGVVFAGTRGRTAAEANVTVPSPTIDAPRAESARDETIVFAGGCFWGVQAVFEHTRGVKSAVSGYAGGTTVSPDYEEVSSGTTGHAESVQVVFDPSQVSLGTLLQVFFSVVHDPTQKNRQGPDVGTQYRSAVFYTSDEQRQVVDAYIKQLTDAKTFARPIVTQVASLRAFYPAEAYHQHYAMLHPDSPYISMYDLPKVAALKTRYPALYREDTAAAIGAER